jgi:NADH-quinone oxidoreductase subunit G
VAALRDADGRGIVLIGPRFVGSSLGPISARVGYVTRRAGDRGALLAGVHPSLLPGGRRSNVADERAEVEQIWGPILATDAGRSSHQILQACADREIDVLFLIGVDPLRDHPDAHLARRALENVPVKVVQSLELETLQQYASAFLPAAAWFERDGHVTNWEGRAQRLRPVRGPAGISLPDWEIFASLALAMGGDLGFETLEELHEEMGALLAPSERGLDVEPQSVEPAASDGSLTLFTYPLLVDDGRLSEGAEELKAALSQEAFVELHVDDAEALGVGDRAVVRTDAGAATLPVHVTEHIAKGTVFVPFNNPGLAANTLLSGSFTTSATVERVEEPAMSGAEQS